MFSDRNSCKAWWANQFRLLLSSAAYVLLEALYGGLPMKIFSQNRQFSRSSVHGKNCM